VTVDGRCFGVLGFGGPMPRPRPFSSAERDFVAMMSLLLGCWRARQESSCSVVASDNLLKDALESVTDGVALYDADDRLVLCNAHYRAAYPMLADLLVPGVAWETLLRALIDRRVIRIPAADVEAWTDSLIAGHRQPGAPRIHQRTDERWEQLHEYRTGEGGTFVVRRDITASRNAEKALFDAKERALVTLRSIADAVIATDSIGRVEFLNPVAEERTGWPLAEAIGRPITQVFRVIDERSRLPTFRPINRCLSESEAASLVGGLLLLARDAEETAIEYSVAPILGADGVLQGTVVVFRDTTETHRLTTRLQHEANHDPLTGLANRREFERRLQNAIASAHRYGSRHVLCYIDLDRFKQVNDTAGHLAGDELLKLVPSLLAGKFRERDTFARIGGDEFGLLLDNCAFPEGLKIAELIVAAFAEFRFEWGGETFAIGASVGAVPIASDSGNAAQLLSQADHACLAAKQLGGGRVRVHDPRQKPRSPSPPSEDDGQPPDPHGRLHLFRQRILPLGAKPAEGTPLFEILLRLGDASNVVVPPPAFVKAADQYGLSGSIDRWVIRRTLETLAAADGSEGQSIFVVPLSPTSLQDSWVDDFVGEQIDTLAVDPKRLCFALAEPLAAEGMRNTVRFAERVKELGCRVVLSDFGRGASGLRSLRDLPCDFIKIDGGFVRNLLANHVDLMTVAAINDLAHSLGLATIAEQADSEPIVEALGRIGVDYGRGDTLAPIQPFTPP
jgi:diguanylate cyclase (GGDEF)-like protein/PAS domain S-box-containing protein